MFLEQALSPPPDLPPGLTKAEKKAEKKAQKDKRGEQVEACLKSSCEQHDIDVCGKLGDLNLPPETKLDTLITALLNHRMAIGAAAAHATPWLSA